MIQITDRKIDPESLKKKLAAESCGALVVFEGWVRNHNEGKAVASLEYEAYESLCLKEGKEIIEEAKNRFEVTEVFCSHRVGHLMIGDAAVWIGATAAHRTAAFKACQYVIDEIKLRLPIWKKEHYVDGEANWVNCQQCYHRSQFSFHESDYYEKQMVMKDVGAEGQEKLKGAKVLVVGAGGLGTPALTYLAAAGIGNLTVCDHDRLEASNLHRQTLYSFEDIGEMKAVLAKKRLQQSNPFIKIEAATESFGLANAEDLVARHDLVLDCTDNFKAKFLINDACVLGGVPLVRASIYQGEGQIETTTSDSSCLRCLWPVMPGEGCVGNCEEVGVIGTIPGVIGTLQAQESIRLILGKKVASSDTTVLFDLDEMQMTKIRRPKNPECRLCGESSTISNLIPQNYETRVAAFEVLCDEIDGISNSELIDIREATERREKSNLKNLPMSREKEISNLDGKKNYILVCAKGIRSRQLVAKLRTSGHENFYSLKGGVQVMTGC